MAPGAAFAGDEVIAGALWLGPHPALVDGGGHVRFLERSGAAWALRDRVAAHEGAILCAAPHPDGRSLVTGGDDGRLVQVGLDGSVTQLAAFDGRWVHALVASPVSGAIAAAVGKDACVLRAGEGGVRHRFTHPSGIGGLALDAKGRRLAVAHYGGVSLWWALVPNGGRQLLVWKGSHLAVTWSPDGRHVLTGMQEAALHGWRLADKQHMRMSGYVAKPRSLSWTPKGRFLLTAGADRVIAWPFTSKDGPMGKSPLELGPAGEIVTQVAAHLTQEVHAAGYADGAVRLVRSPDGADITVRPAGDGPVSALAWSSDGNALLWGTAGGRFGVFAPGG